MAEVKFDTEYMDKFKCPHCGHVHREYCELPWTEDTGNEWWCEHCGKQFFYSVHISVRWTTAKDEDDL